MNILTIRSDNGAEYTPKKSNKRCTEKGIKRQLITKTHHNKMSEGYNRTIMEGVRSMLYHAKIPLSF